MADQSRQNNVNKNPSEWKTGAEPATPSQKSYLNTLSDIAGEGSNSENLTKAEAAEQINKLQKKTGRKGGKQRSAKHVQNRSSDVTRDETFDKAHGKFFSPVQDKFLGGSQDKGGDSK